MAVLTQAKVLEIRELYLAGSSEQSIAELFGISRPTAHRAATGKSWNRDGFKLPPRKKAKRPRREPKKICKNGHPFTPENTFIQKNGYNGCRTCQLEAYRRYHKKKRKSRT